MILRWFTLGQIIPMLVVIIILPFGWLVISSAYEDASEQLVDINHKLFQEQLSNLSLEITRYNRKGERESVQRMIAVAGASSTLVYLCLVDDQEIVVNSTRYDWLGKKAKDVIGGLNLPHLAEVVKNKKVHSHISVDSSEMTIYYPLSASLFLKKTNLGHAVLIGKYSFRQQAELLKQKQNEELTYFGLILGLVVFLLVSFLHKLVSQPLKAILTFIHDIKQGKDVQKIRVKGSYEVMHLADTLSSMNQTLQRSQTDLKYAHLLLENVMNSVPDFIFYKDEKGVYLGCNKAFCAFVGKQTEADVVGLCDFDLFDEPMAQFFREKDELMLAKQESQRNEEWVEYPDGKKVLLDTLKTPYYNDKGEVVGLIGISRDITAVKALEEQFNQAQKMEAVGTLVGGIAHDFNNILAAIMGNMYLAKKSVLKHDEAAAVDKIDKIEALSLQVATMITQLLSFSRKGVVQMQVVGMQVFVKESIKLASVTIPENIRVSHDICLDNLVIKADPTQLQQLLLNLLNNARDAVKDAKIPHVKIVLSAYEPSEMFLQKHGVKHTTLFAHLKVMDNGCGIAKQDLKHIFEPFYTTKIAGEGTGLGLSMVYGSVKSHDAIIDVESEQGDGTTFHIYFPVVEEEKTIDVDFGPIASLEAKGETILLADDEQHVREATAEVLESLGYKVLQARDGEAAITVFHSRQEEISLVVLDVVMPKLGGMEVAHRIRKITPKIPVIFMTGYDKDDVLGQGDLLKQSKVLTKPVNFDVLSQVIRHFMD